MFLHLKPGKCTALKWSRLCAGDLANKKVFKKKKNFNAIYCIVFLREINLAVEKKGLRITPMGCNLSKHICIINIYICMCVCYVLELTNMNISHEP